MAGNFTINGGFEYKQDEFIHFVREHNGKTKDIDTAKGKRVYKEYDMREIPFRDIVNMNLNKSGESIPFASNGVINVNRYFFTYWTPILGSDACSLYTLLTEYCNDDTDICFPKEKELAERLGLSKPTVSKKLQLLQDNNFIVVVNRLNKLANNKETSPIYKIRQTIPLLSKEQYKTLPEYLKVKHDKFMDKYGKDTEMTYFKHDFKDTKEGLLFNSEKLISKKQREFIQKVIDDANESNYILVRLSNLQKMLSESFHQKLQEKWFKPSYETFFTDSICIYNEDTVSVDLILKDVGKEIVPTYPKYEEQLIEIFKELYNEPVLTINYYTFKEYIFKLERGN
jgi:transcriptional regulator with XRE-family HTH domain